MCKQERHLVRAWEPRGQRIASAIGELSRIPLCVAAGNRGGTHSKAQARQQIEITLTLSR